MSRRTLLPFTVMLLLIGSFFLYNPGPSSTYPSGGFRLPAVFTASALTRDTTHLPAIRFITKGPALKPATKKYLPGASTLGTSFIPRSLGTPFRNVPHTLRVMVWGGLRGGISAALALSLPGEMSRDLIVSITYVVVVFSIIVQGTTIKRVARKVTLAANANPVP